MDTDDMEFYRDGACQPLALEISRLTGWPILYLTPKGEDWWTICHHAAVMTPDGFLLDVMGAREPSSVHAYYIKQCEPVWTPRHARDVQQDIEACMESEDIPADVASHARELVQAYLAGLHAESEPTAQSSM